MSAFIDKLLLWIFIIILAFSVDNLKKRLDILEKTEHVSHTLP